MNPLVSMVILTYNHEQFIRETLLGAISQDYENLEIIISDDNSSDNTFSLVQKFVNEYKGKHVISVYKNNINLGIGAHFDKVFREYCHGDYIIIHGGDDVSYPNRVTCSINHMQRLNVSSMCFNMMKVDDKTHELGLYINKQATGNILYSSEDYIKGKYYSTGATRIIHRHLVDFFQEINTDCPTEDSVLEFRAMLINGIAFSPETLVKYRIHSNNVSGFHSLMTKIDPKKIFNQYAKDLQYAYDKNFIDYSKYMYYQQHIKDYLHENLAIRKIYNQPYLFLRVIVALYYILTCRYSLHQLLIYIKRK